MLGKMIMALSLKMYTGLLIEVLSIISKKKKGGEAIHHLSKVEWKNPILLYNEALKCRTLATYGEMEKLQKIKQNR